jgi:cellulose synthase/poly-beta-1,6-N-acetylglucosamine synthase-like glycosyltransferase
MLDAVPTYGVIGDTACFGLLNCLRILHLAYDLLLTRVLGRGVEELVEAENRVVTGLEEIYEARHQIYRSVSDWWWLAEENLGISELNNAINEKLSRIHTIITTKTEQKTNKQLTLITLITAILTAITIIPIIEKYLLPIISPALPTLTNTLPLTLSIIISTIITATAIYIAPHTATALLTILTKIKLTKTTLKPIKTKSKS